MVQASTSLRIEQFSTTVLYRQAGSTVDSVTFQSASLSKRGRADHQIDQKIFINHYAMLTKTGDR